jgi:SAM-dependent methyltransferase
MVGADLEYVERLLRAKAIDGPVLELGTGYDGSTCRDLVKASGLPYFGTDLHAGSGVDVVANFEHPEEMAAFRHLGPFGTLLILNVLEHTFDPIRVLDNARSLLKPGGALAVLTPAIWPLHNFPMDTWRILPNFYEEYARRRNMRLVLDHFEYVGFGAVARFRDEDARYSFPPPSQVVWKRLYGRVIHKAFNTFGRSMFHPSHVAVGALLVSDAAV